MLIHVIHKMVNANENINMWWREGPLPKKTKTKSEALSRLSLSSATLIASSDEIQPTRWSPNSIVEVVDASSLFQFSADGGLIGPLTSNLGNGLVIKAYQQVPAQIREQVVTAINVEWSELTDAFIRANWPGGSDIFYVLVSMPVSASASASASVECLFVGCMAVDRRNFYPYISNLYTVASERKKGHGRTLLDHGMAFTKSMKFPDARLWCKPALLPWYQSMGWTVDGVQRGNDGEFIHLMVRKC